IVSGLVTSPCDQLRIFSGEARLMRMASKSAIVLPRSNGLERYKVASDVQHLTRLRVGSELSLQSSVVSLQDDHIFCSGKFQSRVAETKIGCVCRRSSV